MTEQRQPNQIGTVTDEMSRNRQPQFSNTRNLKGRLGVAGVASALVLAGALGMNTISGGGKTEASSSYSPSPSATELATPRPSEAGSSPSASPEASQAANIENITVKQLEPFEVKVGDWISADVTMADTQDQLKDPNTSFPLNDSDYDYLNSEVKVDITRTAMGVDVQAPGWVIAPYGDITVVRGMTADQKAYSIANEIALKTRGGQFDKFDIVTWKGLNNTVSEAGKMHDGNFVGTGENSTGTPTAENMANMTVQEKLNFITQFMWDNEINPNNPDAKEMLDLLAACLCGCSAPAESPKPTPEPSGEACIPGMTDLVVKKGTVWHSKGLDFIIQGDVTIDGKPRYTIGDPKNDKSIDWVHDGKNHTVVFDNQSNRSIFTACTPDSTEQNQYNHDKTQDPRKIDPKSLILK